MQTYGKSSYLSERLQNWKPQLDQRRKQGISVPHYHGTEPLASTYSAASALTGEQEMEKPISNSTPEDQNPLHHQEGGDHYKAMVIQPIEYIYRNGIGFMEGNVIKYVTRWNNKGGVEDLRKARHYLDMLIAFVEEQK